MPRVYPRRVGALALALVALPASPARADGSRVLGAGAWSYFGDPRAIHHAGHTFTGWISVGGDVVVAELGLDGRAPATRTVFRGLGRDDHGNPSLVFRPDGRVAVFFAPHSGHLLPPGGRVSRLSYRIATRPYSAARWGPVRTIPTNAAGRLGFTYPNPVQQRDRLWVFWRGGGWNPTWATSRDGRRWTRARELVRGAPGQRPYAKVVGDGRATIDVVVSDGHPHELPSSLFYVRIRRAALLSATGRRVGTLARAPLPVGRLQAIHRYRPGGGRAWPHDVALDHGRPVVVYTLRHGGPWGTDIFTYATVDRRGRWRSRRIVSAGAGYRTFTSGGATLDHEDPHVVYLSRTIGARNQVEVWRTPDRGRTWRHVPLTDAPDHWSIRPASPRGLGGGVGQVLFVTGDERTRSYADFHTNVVSWTGVLPG